MRVVMHAHPWRYDRPFDVATRHDRTGTQQAAVDERRLAILAARNLGRRQRWLVSEHWPLRVVQIEHRQRRKQIHVRIEVGVDGADIAPVTLLAFVLPRHNVCREVVHVCHASGGERGNDVRT